MPLPPSRPTAPAAARCGRRRWLAAAAGACLAPGLRAQALEPGPAPAGGVVSAFRVTAVGEEGMQDMARRFAPWRALLERRLGVPVVWWALPDTAVTEALARREVDLAWLGGCQYLLADALARSLGGAGLQPLVQRVQDAAVRSVFITRAGSGVQALGDLKDRTLSFGHRLSITGHLLPRSALLAGGLQPEADLRRLAYAGGAEQVMAIVAQGKVDAGALGQNAWELARGAPQADPALRVFHLTAACPDALWVVQAGLPAAWRDTLRRTFLDLDPDTHAGLELAALYTRRYLPADPDDYRALRAAAENAQLLR